MKTSNIIKIAFATFVVGGILTLFVDGKQNRRTNENDFLKNKRIVYSEKDANFSYKEFPLQAFSVVVAENGSDLHVDQSDSQTIKVQYDVKKSTPAKLYEIKNDTLHIYKGLRLFVKCKNLNVIIGNKPFWVGVNNFTPDSLSIKMSGGSLFFNSYGYDKTKASKKLINIGVVANDSAYVQINNIQLKNITVKLNNAEMNMYCSAKSSNVKLENHAKYFSFDNFEKFTIENDTTCKLNISTRL
jgi:hypothetical protein